MSHVTPRKVRLFESLSTCDADETAANQFHLAINAERVSGYYLESWQLGVSSGISPTTGVEVEKMTIVAVFARA